MNKLTVVLAGFISILFATSAIAQVSNDQARMYQLNSTHTGSSTTPGLTPPLKARWTINFGQPISYPLIADGKVFVTVRSPTFQGTVLYALDGASGATIWSFQLGGSSWWSSLCYENGRVFAVNGSGLVRALNGATGAVIWTRDFMETIYTNPLTVFDGVIYTGGGDRLFALSADTGAVLWAASVHGADSAAVVTTDGVWAAYSGPNVVKVNKADGTVMWVYRPCCTGGGGTAPVLYGGKLYVQHVLQDFILDSETGAFLGNYVTKNAPVFSGNMGYFLNGPDSIAEYGILEGRDLNNNNSVVWSFAGDGFLRSGLLIVNGYVYVGSAKGKLYAVDANTGQPVWSTIAGANIPPIDDGSGAQPLTGFAAGEGLLVIPTTTTLIAYEADNAPPSVTWNATVPAANASGWNNTAVDFPFTPAGVNMATPDSPLHFTAEGGNQTQDVTLTGRGGIVTTVTSPAVNIDMTAPTTSANINGSGGEWSTSVQVTLSSNDNLSGVANTFYKLDGGATQTYTSEFSVSSSGSHTLSYWSVDVAGNIESAHSSAFKVDNAAPVTQLSTSGFTGTNGWFRGAVQVSLSASDNNQSGVASTSYSVDGGATQTYSGAFSIPNDGVHQVIFWSVDALGNTEVQQSRTVKIDMTIGTLVKSLSGTLSSLGYYTTPVQVTMTATDTPSGVANIFYRIDGGATNTYTSPFTISTDGIHSVEYSMVDLAGGSITQSFELKIDKTPPVTTVSFADNFLGLDGWYRGQVQISMSATDNLSGLQITQYRIDNGTLKTYTAPFNYGSNGIHTITYWSVDKVANTETVQTVQLKIDQQAPSITMSATPSRVVASSTPVTVTVSGRVTDALSGINPQTVSYHVIDEYSVFEPAGPVTLQPNGDFSFTLTFPATRNASDRQHVYTIYISAGDLAGVGKTQTDTFKIN